MNDIEAYTKRRNEILLHGKPEDLLPLLKLVGHKPDPETLVVTWHKMITAVPTLPLEYRRASKKWLTERGYHSLDDGDL